MKNYSRMYRILGLILLALFATEPVWSQLNIGAVVRPRSELRRGFRTLPAPGSEAAFFVSQRTRLNFGYDHEKVDVLVMLQDIRVWGDQAQAVQVANASVFQAWANIKFGKGFSAKLGRQEFIYDDHRLLGNLDWVQAARSHDGALLKYENKEKGLKIHLASAYNQAQENQFGTTYWVNNYKTLTFGRIEKQIKNLNLSAIHITDGFEAPDSSGQTIYRQTTGATAIFKKDDLQIRAFGYGQWGQDLAYNRRAGYMASIEAKYKINKLTAIGGFDLISGDDATDATDTKTRSFHTLYPTNHKFYGLMDYFLNIPAHTANGGLQDAYLKFKYGFSKRFWLAAHAHYFALAGKVLDPTDATAVLNSYLGAEVDIVGQYVLNDLVKFKGGFSTMFASDSMEAIKGGDKGENPYWAWLMVVVNPTVFKGQK